MKSIGYNREDTIAAIATPPGRGAIAVIRVSGKMAKTIVARFFKGKNLTTVASHTLHYGSWVDDGGKVIDEVVASVFDGPRSFTKEDVVEVSCHGSPHIQQIIMDNLVSTGARPAEPGEFTYRAFLHGRFSLSQAEAVADLISAESEAGRKSALHQMRGGFALQLQQMRAELLTLASLLELELDFSEEDVEFADREKLLSLLRIIGEYTDALLASFKAGNVLKQGVITVLAGKPNAGKSTLFNALVNEDRAIVSDIAGTTRDMIEEVVYIDGIAFRLTDTAGLREARDVIEKIGIEKTKERTKQASLILYVADLGTESPEAIKQQLAELESGDAPIIVLGNKKDLLPDVSALAAYQDGFEHFIAVSAKGKEGLAPLKELMTTLTIGGTMPDEILTNSRHAEVLQRVKSAIVQASEGLTERRSGELVARDIRSALDAMGEITGEVTTEDLLGEIFGKFCIGK